MEVQNWDITTLLADSEPLGDEQFSQLLDNVNGGERERQNFKAYLRQTLEKREAQLAKDPILAIKLAQGFYALGDYAAVVEWFDKASGSKAAAKQCRLKAKSLQRLGQYESAIKEYEQAQSKGYDSFDVSMAIVDCLRDMGDLKGAKARLKKISRVGEIRAEYHYQLGRLLEAEGEHSEAMVEFDKAVALDANHTDSLFHLAYTNSLYGDEDTAVECYKQCIESGSAPVNALLNLANLFEDREDYYPAIRCVRQVLTAFPNHSRARMFFKDIEASTTMYYDEDQARRTDHRNKVMEIPISEFELSVRSRNCLKKVNIRTLGDLMKITESELLAYKNFGETSLQEIKLILMSRGLRLGQLIEDSRAAVAEEKPPAVDEKAGEAEAPVEPDDPELLGSQIGRLGLSVRSRKCLERLNLATIGDLTGYTEAELLGCKNFGMTSLDEVTQRLAEHGLKLRQLKENL